MSSIGSVLDETRGIGRGFDFLRLFLALAILYGHTLWVSGSVHASPSTVQVLHAATTAIGDGAHWSGKIRPFKLVLVPMFFALSGFLVMGSAFRLRDVRTFLAFRGLRLFPALLVEVTLSAVVLGAAATSLPLWAYFSNPGFWRYFGNCLGEVTFNLPGVFLTNPVSGLVNVNLWTLPAEFFCYVIAAALIISGVLYRKTLITVLFLIITAALIGLNTFTNFAETPTVLAPHTITYYFIVGFVFYIWRDKIPIHLGLFLGSFVAAYIIMYFRHTVYIAPPFVVYCMVYIGLLKIPKIPLASTGDYSYGIYLYGFPISQAVVHFIPWMQGRGLITLLATIGLTGLFAALSWHGLEKHALKLKRYLPPKYFPMRARVVITPTEIASVAP